MGYIEREAIMQKFADHVERSNNSDFAQAPTWNEAVQIVEDFPAADVRPVVRGKWENTGSDVWKCSACGYGIMPWNEGVNFCPNCGADMREES